MKKTLIFFFSVLFSVQIFAQATSGTKVTAPIVPNDASDVYPTHDAKWGKDGYRSVIRITERDSIKTGLRTEGMQVYVKADSSIYQLRGGLTNNNWVKIPSFVNIATTSTPDYILVLDGDVAKKIATLDLSIGYSVKSYAAGTVYSLTNTSALCHFGTTDPAIVLDKFGTYAIYWGAAARDNAATFAASQTATFKLRRTNNTPTDLPGATGFFTLPIMATLTDHAGTVPSPPIIYSTLNTTDIIQLWGMVSAATTFGSVDVNQAWIVAIKLY
jgi:hypothetical protein